MAAKKKDLDYYLAQTRRIAESREAGAEREIRKLYKSMLKDLQQFVSETYVQYAKDDMLTFAMLQEAGYNARFLEEVEKHIDVATPKAAKELQQLVNDTYKLAYEGMVDGVAKAGADGLDTAFAGNIAITPEQIKAAVENPVYGLTLKDTLEKNRKEIIYGIKQVVGVGLMNGDRYTTMAKRIAKQVDGDYNKAIRIARTEAHRVRELGNYDAAVKVDAELQNGTTGMRMVKTWKTMKDERVRPQRRRRGKKGWSTKMGKGANHMKMEGQTVLSDELFDLGGGDKATAPGSSGVAGQDINCRCYASYRLMDDTEYFQITGKHFPGYKEPGNIVNSENGGIITANEVLEQPIKSKDVHYAKLLDRLKMISADCKYNPVRNHVKALAENEIIQALAGGDRTSGSCASVGLAYIGQKLGWNVLDFRDGRSRSFFSNSNVLHILSLADGLKVHRAEGASAMTVGNRLLKKVEPGKEYYLCVGRHAAIVRKQPDGVLQYLELQSAWRSGWTNFDKDPKTTLRYRFGCTQSSSASAEYDYMIDLDESNFRTDDFRSLLGYINTAENEQRKGSSGTIK